MPEALGRVLAEDVTAADAVPGFDSSAMDGYALRAADTAGAEAESPARLAVVAESRAGHPSERELGAGEAIKISTGAMVPAGADAVIRVEDTDGGADAVEVRVPVEPGNDIRRAGEDIAAGERVLAAGAELGPAELGVLASVGRAEVACAVRPSVTVLTTGDELQEPGPPLLPGGIRNSNAHSLGALVERAGAVLRATEIVPDDREATTAALGRALAGELTVISGGVSVGEHDHVRPALGALGVEQVFWGVALRPGKAHLLRRDARRAASSSACRATRSRRWSRSCSSSGRRSARCSAPATPIRAGRRRSSTSPTRSRRGAPTWSAAGSSSATTAGTRRRPRSSPRTC